MAFFFTVVVRLRVVGFFFVSELFADSREDEPEELPPSSVANRRSSRSICLRKSLSSSAAASPIWESVRLEAESTLPFADMALLRASVTR